MLPFLKPKKVAGLILEQRRANGSKQEDPAEQSDENQSLMSYAHDLIAAVHAKDSAAVAAALKAAFEVCESEPHEEGPHTNNYDSLNEKAAKGEY